MLPGAIDKVVDILQLHGLHPALIVYYHQPMPHPPELTDLFRHLHNDYVVR